MRLRMRKRLGLSIVETAIVLSLVMVLVFVSFELCLIVLRQGSLAQVCRDVAREVSCRGTRSSAPMGVSPINMTGGQLPAVVPSLKSSILLDPTALKISVQWLDAKNSPGQRIQVNGLYSQSSNRLFSAWLAPTELRASSTALICN